MTRIPLWIDLRDVPVGKRVPYLRAAKRADVEHVLVAKGDPHAEREEALVVDGRNTVKRGKEPVGKLVKLRRGADQDRAAEADGIVVVDAEDWTVIPLENLIARRRDRPGTLFAVARSPEQSGLFRDTLEVGVHGIVLVPRTADDVEATDALLRKKGAPAAAAQATQPSAFLVPATVTAVNDAGPGDRVCVDATSRFEDGEGLLVGSTARGFALVHAETLHSEYVNARPFRVNAGAIHSYLLGPDDKTQYLSEIRTGSQVLAVRHDGTRRTLTVGRAKIEHRPHVLVTWQTDDGRTGNAVLQNAETIRLVRPGGEPIGVHRLQVGDTILVHTEEAARHFGMAVDERLEER